MTKLRETCDCMWSPSFFRSHLEKDCNATLITLSPNILRVWPYMTTTQRILWHMFTSTPPHSFLSHCCQIIS